MKRWKHRPEGSTWGDWGDDDQLGRLNLITPKKVLEGVAEVKEGLSFCLSLPLDVPGGNVLNPRRLPPVLSPTGDENGWRFNFLTNTLNPLFMDVASDDRVILTLQYSTQWDTLAHVGGMFDADGDGVPEPLYYNGFKAGSDIVGPQPDAGRDGCGHMSYAHKLGVENMAAKAIQGRAVMVDLEKHYGRDHKYVNYDDFRRVLEADKVVVEPGDMLLLYTGFTDEIVKMGKKIDPPRCHAMCCVLDGRDKRLLQWITDSHIAALIADNYGVEAVPARPGPDECGTSVAADPQSLPVQARPQSRRDLVAEGAGAVAARQEALALPADRTAAEAARRRRIARDARRDRLGMTLAFPAFVAAALNAERFRLLDVGCSGGIDTAGVPSNPGCKRSASTQAKPSAGAWPRLEHNPEVSYVAAFVGNSASEPIDLTAGPAAPLIMRMRDRLSFMRTREIREPRLKAASARREAASQRLGADRTCRFDQADRGL